MFVLRACIVFVGPVKALPLKMYQALPRCSTSGTLTRIFRVCNLRRRYLPVSAETTSTEISKTKEGELQKKRDPTMLEVLFAYVNT